jgi:hypothetical protein
MSLGRSIEPNYKHNGAFGEIATLNRQLFSLFKQKLMIFNASHIVETPKNPEVAAEYERLVVMHLNAMKDANAKYLCACLSEQEDKPLSEDRHDALVRAMNVWSSCT